MESLISVIMSVIVWLIIIASTFNPSFYELLLVFGVLLLQELIWGAVSEAYNQSKDFA
jgi:hypothetical protein